MLPLCDFDGWLKQIRGEDLCAPERIAIECAFPWLAAPETSAADAAAEEMRRINAGHADPARIDSLAQAVRVNKRRYAGDHTLGPRNYHTLSRDAQGDDASTLIAELAAYADDQVPACEVNDCVSPDRARELGIAHRERSILIRFQGTPGSNAAIARLGTDAVWIPYRVERTRIEGVIDLRLPPVQDWFVGEFSDFHRHTMAVLETGKKPGATLPSLSRTDAPTTFHAMLPVLMDPKRGGNTVTDHIGQWMRLHGVNALVYPSARLPVGVQREGGTMRRWMGWNLVDYRGRDPQVFKATTILLGDDPWASPHAAQFKLERRDASWVMVPPTARFSARRPIRDDDLRVRYAAAESVFRGLIMQAAKHQNATEDAWLESLCAACATDLGRRILAYMGIQALRTSPASDGSIAALLLECWHDDESSGRLSKGYACIPEGGTGLRASLDGLEDPTPGTPAFMPIGDGMHLYLLREA